MPSQRSPGGMQAATQSSAQCVVCAPESVSDALAEQSACCDVQSDVLSRISIFQNLAILHRNTFMHTTRLFSCCDSTGHDGGLTTAFVKNVVNNRLPPAVPVLIHCALHPAHMQMPQLNTCLNAPFKLSRDHKARQSRRAKVRTSIDDRTGISKYPAVACWLAINSRPYKLDRASPCSK